MTPDDRRVHVAASLAAIVIGALFVLLAVARPAFLWDLGKVQRGRAWIGDTGLQAAFTVLGLALVGAGVLLLRKRKR